MYAYLQRTQPDVPRACASSDTNGWSRFLLSHKLDVARSYCIVFFYAVALDTGPAATENQFPSQTLVACLDPIHQIFSKEKPLRREVVRSISGAGSYAPLFGGRSCSIPEDMILDV